jgi:TonB family protein
MKIRPVGVALCLLLSSAFAATALRAATGLPVPPAAATRAKIEGKVGLDVRAAQSQQVFPPGPASDREFLDGVVRWDAPGVRAPVARSRVSPKYTREALQNRLEGEVVVEAVVDPSGEVSRVRIKQSLDTVYGLDEAALNAALRWQFEPGAGQRGPVPVLVQLNLEFRVH